MKLFIIGNGFDLDHNLPTSYGHFRDHLAKEYGAVDYVPLPSVGMDPDGGVTSSMENSAHILYGLINKSDGGGEWGRFEDYLGLINYKSFMDLNRDRDDIYYQAQDNSDPANDYLISFSNFPRLFTEWVETFDWQDVEAREKYKRLFNEDGIFLVFNYTTVLEDKYKIGEERICHIHGKIGEKLVFGHANDGREFSDDLLLGEADMAFDEMHRALRKDSFSCIQKNYGFLNQISDVDEIYIIGWGAGDSDKDYRELLKHKLDDRKVILHFTKWDREHDKIERIKEALKGLNYEEGEDI